MVQLFPPLRPNFDAALRDATSPNAPAREAAAEASRLVRDPELERVCASLADVQPDGPVVSQCRTLDQAKAELDRLHLAGHCQTEIDEAGTLVYFFQTS